MLPPAIIAVVTRLERWGSPVPAEQAALRRAYERESLGLLRELVAAVARALLLFFTCFWMTDWLFYREVFWQLLPLRLVMIGAYLTLWRSIGRARGARHTLGLMTLAFGVGAVANAGMLLVNGDPVGIYATPFIAGPAVLALMPLPRAWYALDTALLAALYVLTMAAGGLLGEPGVANYIVAIVSATVLFGFFHSYQARQRWEGFANRVRVEQLGERLAGELAMARRIQQSLLPPARPGWDAPDLACWSGPAREVGGDFYAYARMPDGRVGLSVGDVSGKGLPAALLVSTCLALLRGATVGAASPGELLASLDLALADSTRATRQNCALCCVDLAGGSLRAANAGGIAPLVRRAGGRVEWVDAGGLPLGTGLAGSGYSDSRAQLAPGDMLVLVSDGVLEAVDEAGQLFGFERLEAAVAALAADTAFAAVAELREALAAFTGRADPHDDMTIVALRA